MTNELTTAYNAHSASHSYWFGFVVANLLYVVAGMTFEELSAYFKNDRASASKGGFRKIRIKAKSADLKALLPKARLLGSADLLLDEKYNKGEMFEKVITETFTGEKWVKDSVPFFMAGDAVINGVNVQIKLNGAELTNERTLKRFAFI